MSYNVKISVANAEDENGNYFDLDYTFRTTDLPREDVEEMLDQFQNFFSNLFGNWNCVIEAPPREREIIGSRNA